MRIIFIAIKDYLLEVSPQTPNWGVIYKALYNNRIHEEDQMDLASCGTPFEDLVKRFPISEEELQGVSYIQQILKSNSQ